MAHYIRKNVIKLHHYFSDRIFANLANMSYMEKYQNEEENVLQFLCSHSFITDFKQRYGIPSCKAHFMERLEKEEVDILCFK